MIERVAKSGRDCSGKSQKFIIVAGVAGNQSFGHTVRTHRSPFVMVPIVAIGQPNLSQVLKAPIQGYIGRRYMTMVIEKGHGLSELEVEFLAHAGREQIILGRKELSMGIGQVGVYS